MSNIPAGYKQTEVGVIPEDWEVVHLSELGKFKNGINKSSEAFGHGSPFVNLMDVFGVSSIALSDALGLVDSNNAEQQTYDLRKGDVIFIRSSVKPSGVGLTAVVEEDLPKTVYSGFLIRFRDSGALDNGFKRHCFYQEGFRKRVISGSSVSANTNINQDNLKRLLIAIPPTKAEQTAIAAALSDADALITDIEKLIAKKRNIKQGTMQELLTGKKRLPGFSGEWEVKKLGEIADINMGQSPDSKNYNSRQIGVPLIQGNADIENRKSIKRIWTTQITKTCDEGDLIMTVRAPVGAIGIASENSCIGRGVCSLKPKNSYRNFLYHLLIYNEDKWKIVEQGSTFTSANSSQILNFQLSIVNSIAEQTAIAQILSDMDAEIEQLEQKMDKYRLIKQGMMQELLTGRIRLV